MFFFFKQKTAYEMRISDWSSDVCSSDLCPEFRRIADRQALEAPVDRVEIMFEVGWLHAGIDGRKSAADIDDIHCHRRRYNRRAHALQRIAIGMPRHRLAADAKADATRIDALPGSETGRASCRERGWTSVTIPVGA